MTIETNRRADHAKEAVAAPEAIVLTTRDWETFLAALDDAEQPRPRLTAAARRYRSRRFEPPSG